MPHRKRTQDPVNIVPELEEEEPEFYDVEVDKAKGAFSEDIDRSLNRFGFTLFHSLTPELQTRVLKHLGITREDSAKDQYNLGCVLAADGDLTGAITAFATAARLEPDFPEARYNLALALEKSGEMAAAKEQWTAYAELSQNEAEREAVIQHLGTLA
jgi:tetratricopeptide (TPR) repeat protein